LSMLASRFVLLIVINAKKPVRAVERGFRKGCAINGRILTLYKEYLSEHALLAFYKEAVLITISDISFVKGMTYYNDNGETEKIEHAGA
jgi:hypothetical protein